MISNIGKTFTNCKSQYTILEEAIINTDGYTVTLAVKNNVEFPSYVVAQGVDIETGCWHSGRYSETLEGAFLEMEKHRIVARKLEGTTHPCLYHFEIISNALSNDMGTFVELLSKNSNTKHELEEAINFTNLKNELIAPISFQDLKQLSFYCHEVWLKLDTASLEQVFDYVAYILNENTDISVNEICDINIWQFGCAVLDMDYDIKRIIAKNK